MEAIAQRRYGLHPGYNPNVSANGAAIHMRIPTAAGWPAVVTGAAADRLAAFQAVVACDAPGWYCSQRPDGKPHVER